VIATLQQASRPTRRASMPLSPIAAILRIAAIAAIVMATPMLPAHPPNPPDYQIDSRNAAGRSVSNFSTPRVPPDTDGDGTPDNADPDIDGNGIPNEQDPDSDGDGVPNSGDQHPNDPTRWQDVPVTQLAAIDISGTSTEGNEVTALALDDQNNAAFAYKEAGANGHVVAKRWANGQLDANSINRSPMPDTQQIAVSGDEHTSTFDRTLRSFQINAAGKIFGECLYWSNDFFGNETYMPGGFSTVATIADSTATTPLAALYPGGITAIALTTGYTTFQNLRGDSYSGYFFRHLEWPDAHFVHHAGTTTAFVRGNSTGTTSGLITVGVPEGSWAWPFQIYSISENGWAAGGIFSDWQWSSGGVWEPDAETVTALGASELPFGVNNQGRVIGGNSSTNEGFLWYQGTSTAMPDLIPEAYRQQVRKLSPVSIANADDSGATRILISAESLEGEGSGSWIERTFVLTYRPPGSASETSLARLQFPQGVGGGFMNKHGILATLGKPPPSATSTHAILLVPVELNSTVAVNTPQFFAKAIPEDPDTHRPTERDLKNLKSWVKKLEALVIFYDAVYDTSSHEVADFDINLACGLKSDQGLTWSKVSGPESGELTLEQTANAKYSNPKIGGLYRFDLDLFGTQTVGTQALLPLAGADCMFWIYHEVVAMREWARSIRAQAEIDCYSAIPGLTSYNLFRVWVKISAAEFDYVIEPVNSDKTAPTLAFEPELGSGGGIGALYSYTTVNGTVVHGSKINTLLWGVFGRYWGYSTSQLMLGAQANEIVRKWSLDRESSQSAVLFGGHFMDVYENQGVSTLLQQMQEANWNLLVDPVDLIEEKLWPCLDNYDEDKSTFRQPNLSTSP